ncbi:MAG: alpha/beta hydrolase-fold protein [Bacteroidetes bacterium]|nr:alpha/beta hydrolase-fold protein [Bacteroidota bacterium]
MSLSVHFGYQRQHPQAGKLHSVAMFPSEYVEARRIDVWLPNKFDHSKKYAVLYMHDGQNLFDSEYTFNGISWAADRAMQKLIDEEKVRPTIIVGIWNTDLRYQEYFPVAAYEKLPAALKRKIHFKNGNSPLSDAYLKFLVTELKPFIDANYAVQTDADSTFIAGSSMGGLISVYALASYPDIFGGAACLSTHWPLGEELDNTAFSKPYIDWLGTKLPSPGKHRIYFDYGTDGFDTTYQIHQEEMDRQMSAIGYSVGKNWLTYRAEGDKHNEIFWSERLHIPLHFLLRKTL